MARAQTPQRPILAELEDFGSNKFRNLFNQLI